MYILMSDDSQYCGSTKTQPRLGVPFASISQKQNGGMGSMCVAWSTMKDSIYMCKEISQQVFRVFQWAEQWD